MDTDLSRTVDTALVLQAQRGDPAAVALLVGAVRTAVLRYTRIRLSTYVGGRDAAEDVTQDVCLAVVNVLSRYDDRGAPFGALVYSIAANKVADAQRRYARSRADAVEKLPERADPDGVEQHVIANLDVAAAWALVDALPTRSAAIVRLRAHGYTVEEVGARLGMNASAVRVAHHRALTKVRAAARV